MSKIDLHLFVDTTSIGGEPTSDEQYCDREPGYISINRIKVRKDRGPTFYGPDKSLEGIDLPDDSGFIRIAMIRYYDGDTFGSTSGHYEFLPFLYPTTKNHFDIDEEEERMKKEHKFVYFSWRGYFSGFESIQYFDVDLSLLETRDQIEFSDDNINEAKYDIKIKHNW